MANQPLATYLRTYRRRVGLSQEDIAFLLGGMSGTSVSRHECSARVPKLETALMYEFVFGVTVRELHEGIFVHLREEVRSRARGYLASLKRKPETKERLRKIEVLGRLISEDSAEVA